VINAANTVDLFTVMGSGAATFSSSVSATTGTTGATIKLTGFTNYGTIQDVNDVRRIWFENTGSFRTIFDLPSTGTEFAFRTNAGTYLLSLASTGAATFSSDVTIGPSNGSFKGFGHSVNVSSVSQGGLFPYSGVTGSGADYSPTLFGDGSNNLYFCAGGSVAKKMTITSGGNVGIGYDSPLSLLQVGSVGNSTVRFGTSSTTNTSATYSFVAWNTSGNDILSCRGDSLVTMPALVSTWTTGNAANMWANPASGDIYRSTSSIKYKKNVANYAKGLAEVMQLRPVSYEGKHEVDAGKTFAGLIAEDIHELGLTEFVQYAEDGTPDALAYSNMIALLTKAIQEQQAQIEEQQQQINSLINK